VGSPAGEIAAALYLSPRTVEWQDLHQARVQHPAAVAAGPPRRLAV